MPFKKGQIAWNRGLLRTAIEKKNMSEGWKRRFSNGGKSYGKENALKGREKIRKSKLQDKNPQWKGDDVGYKGLHIWVTTYLGKSEYCKHCGIKGSILKGRWNIDWANKSGLYKRELNDWIGLCKKCHVSYDRKPKLIDLGALDSLIPIWAKKECPKSEVWALDYAEEAIKELQKKYPQVNYRFGNVYNTGFPNEYFDYAVLGEVIEHLDFPQQAIKEAFRILKKGGTLALSTPFNEAIELGAVDLEHHVWSFDKLDMEKMLSSYGEVEIKILRTKDFKSKKYVFPIMLVYVRKV